MYQFILFRFLIALTLVLVSIPTLAQGSGKVLPLPSLRDQGQTPHCWAYSTSHVLESHLQFFAQTTAGLDIEQDLEYFNTYERLLQLYSLKKPVGYNPFTPYGFEMEYWDLFMKHGKGILFTEQNADYKIPYLPPRSFKSTIGFIPKTPSGVFRTCPGARDVITELRGQPTQAAAITFIEKVLAQCYPKPAKQVTQWLGQEVPLSSIPKLILGPQQGKVGFVVVTMTTFDTGRWARIIDERFWSYRIPLNEGAVFKVVKTALDNGWALALGDESHTRALIGYDTNSSGFTTVALADSYGQNVKWLGLSDIIGQGHDLTVSYDAIKTVVPPPQNGLNYFPEDSFKNYDLIDRRKPRH